MQRHSSLAITDSAEHLAPDVTYVPAVIGALFVATVLYVGFASWRR
jgi:hypothetical protein